MTEKTVHYRQGDIMLKKIKKIPSKAEKKETDIVLEGEATGHAHRIVNGSIFEVQHWNESEVYIDATSKECKLIHDEHNTIDLEPGYYEMVRQREYDPNQFSRDGKFRYVLD